MTLIECSNGHPSKDPEWCDTCGAKIGGGLPGSGAPSPPPVPTVGSSITTVTCPHCSTVNPADNLFCEACGYDFTTGQVPAGPAPRAPADGPLMWTVIVEVSQDWYALKGTLADQPCPPPSTRNIPISGRLALIGRSSQSRATAPEVALDADTGVSRRHAQFAVTGTSLTVVDLSSTNGTFVFAADAPIDDHTLPLTPGVPVPLDDGDRVFVGAWSQLTVRVIGTP